MNNNPAAELYLLPELLSRARMSGVRRAAGRPAREVMCAARRHASALAAAYRPPR